MSGARDSYDVVIVGAGIAGCTAARLYAQNGLRVALVERRSHIGDYKRMCTHFIQPSATPTIERLGLAALIEEAGGIRNSLDTWTRWGWICVPQPKDGSAVTSGQTGQLWLLEPNTARAFLNTVEVGDTVFINAYLIAITVFGNRDMGQVARIASEFMAVEAVHRALARQGNFKVGNDKVYSKYSQAEEAQDSPIRGVPGFRRITSAVTFLQSRGIGFGAVGRLPDGTTPPGRFYDFAEVSRRTPDPEFVNQRSPR